MVAVLSVLQSTVTVRAARHACACVTGLCAGRRSYASRDVVEAGPEEGEAAIAPVRDGCGLPLPSAGIKSPFKKSPSLTTSSSAPCAALGTTGLRCQQHRSEGLLRERDGAARRCNAASARRLGTVPTVATWTRQARASRLAPRRTPAARVPDLRKTPRLRTGACATDRLQGAAVTDSPRTQTPGMPRRSYTGDGTLLLRHCFLADVACLLVCFDGSCVTRSVAMADAL